MPRAVYSTRFLATAGDPIATVEYTVPDGFVAVVRDVTGYAVNGGTGGITVWLSIEGWVLWHLPAPPSVPTTYTQSMRVVLQAGETLTAQGGYTATSSVLVSGYLLSS